MENKDYQKEMLKKLNSETEESIPSALFTSLPAEKELSNQPPVGDPDPRQALPFTDKKIEKKPYKKKKSSDKPDKIKEQWCDLTIPNLKKQMHSMSLWRTKQSLERNYKNLAVTDLSTCIRNLFFRWDHAEADVEKMNSYLWGSMMADAGTGIHKYLSYTFRFHQTSLRFSWDVGKGLVKGEFDAVDKFDGKTWIVEIKTAQPHDFVKDEFTYKPEAYNQAAFYAHAAVNHLGWDIDGIKLLYVPRSCIEYKMWEFPYDDALKQRGQELQDKANEFFELWEQKKLPDLNHKLVDKSQCHFCGYEKTVCRVKKNYQLSRGEDLIPMKEVEEVSDEKTNENNKKRNILNKEISKKISPKIIDLR